MGIIFMLILIAVVAMVTVITGVLTIIKHLNHVSNLTSTINALSNMESDNPEPKSVGGATEIYLKQIKSDFPDFAETEAESAIHVFMHEYLNIIYNQSTKFDNANVDDRLLDYFNRNNLAVEPIQIIINQISITSYKKSDEYATIAYNVSIGYNINNTRVETRYQLNYTFKLLDQYRMSEALICANCGGSLESTSTMVCPYCDTKIIRDTIMSWKFSSIKEI